MITLCACHWLKKAGSATGSSGGFTALRRVPGLMGQLAAQPSQSATSCCDIAGLTEQPLAGGLIQRLVEDAASPLRHRPVGGQLHIAQQFGAQHGL